MALHGSVNVNGREISLWWAERSQTVEIAPDGLVTYDCGYSNAGESNRFVVKHYPYDGAETLAMKVLQAIPSRVRREEIEESRRQEYRDRS